jgi:enoyl-CoA hydratase/carnithine racemase
VNDANERSGVSETVRIERCGDRVAELVMDRPLALNAVNTDQAVAIADACAELAADPTLSVVIISSAVAKA